MAKPTVIVDRVRGLALPNQPMVAAQQGGGGGALPHAVVHTGGGASLLDLADPRAGVWGSLLGDVQATNDPVYLETDPATNVITRLLFPLAVVVTGVAPAPVGTTHEVTFAVSAARHHLDTTDPDYPQLLAALTAAGRAGTPVLVTESLEDNRIIDVRPDPSPFAAGPVAMMAVGPAGGPGGKFAPAGVTPQQAQQMFALVAGQTYIPFTFPRDGCWGRAHEMVRLILVAGVTPRKVWLYGNLRVKTKNDPNCAVSWGYHVAPTLLVDTGSSSQIQVIDPSMFTGPVPQAAWVSAQNDPAAALHDTDATVFYRAPAGQLSYDPLYTQTQQVLATYRRQLALRNAQFGPPPYNCP